MTKAEAKARFIEEVLGHVPPHDEPALAEEWNNYTDMLREDGQITAHQYSTWTHPTFTSADHFAAIKGASER